LSQKAGHLCIGGIVFFDYRLGTVSNLASELISLRIKIYTSEEADKASCYFTASIAFAYRLLTRKITFLDRNCDLLILEHFLKHKQRFRKL
jgi:hypothetical protein